MTSAIRVGETSYWLNDLLKQNLDYQKELTAKNFDNFTIIDGMEGYGKTTLAVTILHYLTDGRFSVDDIVFTPDEFEAWIHDPARRPGDGLLWDEFVLAGMSQDALSLIQKKIIKYMTLLRKKRFHIILVIPYVFMLRKYFAVARARNLIHVAPKGGNALERGDFWFFNYKTKRQVYVRGHKIWEYCAKPDFKGHFCNPPQKIIDWKEYEERKDAAIKGIDEENAPTRVKQLQHQREILIRELKDRMTQKQIAKLIGMSEGWVSGIFNKVQDST